MNRSGPNNATITPAKAIAVGSKIFQNNWDSDVRCVGLGMLHPFRTRIVGDALPRELGILGVQLDPHPVAPERLCGDGRRPASHKWVQDDAWCSVWAQFRAGGGDGASGEFEGHGGAVGASVL